MYRNPKAVIYKTTTRKVDAPYLASFSSKGPQTIALNILKVILNLFGVLTS